MNSTNQTNKFTRFLRNNAALLVLICCVVAITAVVLAVSLSNKEDVLDKPVDATPNPPADDTPVVTPPADDTPATPTVVKEKIYFECPVQYQTVGMGFTDNTQVLFVFNQTLNKWETHKALDLIAAENTVVTSMYNGTVIEVGESYGMGHYVKVDHGENVIATYASLADVQVVAGQNLSKGEKIGVVSTTASYEFVDGAHLHLEITKDGKAVDPMDYVSGKVYREVEKVTENTSK